MKSHPHICPPISVLPLMFNNRNLLDIAQPYLKSVGGRCAMLDTKKKKHRCSPSVGVGIGVFKPIYLMCLRKVTWHSGMDWFFIFFFSFLTFNFHLWIIHLIHFIFISWFSILLSWNLLIFYCFSFKKFQKKNWEEKATCLMLKPTQD